MNRTNPSEQGFTRRTFLVGAFLLGSVAVAARYAYPGFKRRFEASTTLDPGVVDNRPFDRSALNASAHYICAVFGVNPSENDVDELVGYLEFLVVQQNGWRSRLRWLHGYLDSLAPSGNFAEAKFQEKAEIAEAIAKSGGGDLNRVAKIMAMFSKQRRERILFHKHTHWRLVAIYKHSGVQWRLRGYSSWPGIPGDPRDYVRSGPNRSC